MGEHGLARPGLPREHVQPWPEAELGPLDQQEVLDAQFVEHTGGLPVGADGSGAFRPAATQFGTDSAQSCDEGCGSVVVPVRCGRLVFVFAVAVAFAGRGDRGGRADGFGEPGPALVGHPSAVVGGRARGGPGRAGATRGRCKRGDVAAACGMAAGGRRDKCGTIRCGGDRVSSCRGAGARVDVRLDTCHLTVARRAGAWVGRRPGAAGRARFGRARRAYVPQRRRKSTLARSRCVAGGARAARGAWPAVADRSAGERGRESGRAARSGPQAERGRDGLARARSVRAGGAVRGQRARRPKRSRRRW